MSRTITFFVTEPIEELTVASVAEEATRRGHAVRFESRLDAEADVGIYVPHATAIPRVNAHFSMVMLHDLGQQQVSWPHFWQVEPWDRFDVGLLPGPAWRAMYEASSVQPGFRGPRLGVYTVGWPKFDRVVAREAALRDEVRALAGHLNLPAGPNILYAPSYENDGKQDDVVAACRNLEANLLIKHASWPERYPERIKAIAEAERKHRGQHPRVFILDHQLDIMTALAMADVLVTDESNVMFEALLFGVPAISVQDWMVPCETPPRRVWKNHDFAIPSTRAELARDMQRVMEAHRDPASPGAARDLAAHRDRWFSHRGRSGQAILDLLEWMAGPSPESQALAGPQPRILSLERTLNELQQWRSTVHRSASWRLTAPLRRMVDRSRPIKPKVQP